MTKSLLKEFIVVTLLVLALLFVRIDSTSPFLQSYSLIGLAACWTGTYIIVGAKAGTPLKHLVEHSLIALIATLSWMRLL